MAELRADMREYHIRPHCLVYTANNIDVSAETWKPLICPFKLTRQCGRVRPKPRHKIALTYCQTHVSSDVMSL